MASYDLFSKRERRRRGGLPDVYRYDAIPDTLRAQRVLIIRDAIGEFDRYHDGGKPLRLLKLIHDALCREYGVFTLQKTGYPRAPNPQEDVYRFLVEEPDVERVIDAVELALRLIDSWCR